VIATDSTAPMPSIRGLAEHRVWTSLEATT
jgi:hypothetical protein